MWPGFNGLYSWWGSTISDSLILISFKSRQVRKALRKLWRWQRVVWNCKSINDRQTIGWIKHWFTNDYTYNIRLLSTGICYLSRLWLFCVDLLLLLLPIVLKNNLAFLYFDIDRNWWRIFQKCVVRTNCDIYVSFTAIYQFRFQIPYHKISLQDLQQ